jgi:RNA polymerase sigma-70 factor (ECF subfamily)
MAMTGNAKELEVGIRIYMHRWSPHKAQGQFMRPSAEWKPTCFWSLPEGFVQDSGALMMNDRDPTDTASPQLQPSQRLQALSSGLQNLYRRAYRLLGNKADAEDAVQDALLGALKHLDQFRGEAQISTWLMTIVTNCARMQLRKRSHYKHLSLDSRIGDDQGHRISEVLMDERPNPEQECHESKLRARLMKSAARLSPTLHRTFHLWYVDHLSASEIARVLEVPVGTVKAQIARARAKLLKSVRRKLQPAA